MAIRVKCPTCKKTLTAPVQLSGQERSCPHCGGKVVLPMAKIPIVANQDHAHDAASPSHDWFNTPKAAANPNDLIDMTAMVDIVFFLLIYFLVTSFVALSAAINSPASEATIGKTARSDAEKESQSVQPLTVKIDADGIIWVEGDPVQSAHDLVQRLKAAKEDTGADGLRIASSPEATHGKVVMVLDSGLAAGFKEAQLALEEMQ